MKIAHRIIITLLLLTMPFRAVADTMYVLCSPTGQVNIRERPTTHSAISGHLYAGDQVETIESRKDGHGTAWHKIDGVTEYGWGWVSGEYLVSSPAILVDADYIIRSNGRVAIRSTPGGSRKAWARDGDIVHVIQIAGGWAQTENGYISEAYLERR